VLLVVIGHQNTFFINQYQPDLGI